MGTKLYVANLPAAPSVIALRAHFSTCGTVSDVEIISERHSGRGRGSALVRMGSEAAAERALAELNGALFGGQLLLIEAAPGEAKAEPQRPRRAEPIDEDAGARITLQFREAANMTYELDCSGLAIMLRIFFPNETGQWRIVAQASHDAGVPSSSASAPSRVEALRQIARACREGTDAPALRQVDWDAVERALTKVRAL